MKNTIKNRNYLAYCKKHKLNPDSRQAAMTYFFKNIIKL